MAKDEKKNNIDKLSFEEAIKELGNIVGRIEQGEIALADSLVCSRCRLVGPSVAGP